MNFAIEILYTCGVSCVKDVFRMSYTIEKNVLAILTIPFQRVSFIQRVLLVVMFPLL